MTNADGGQAHRYIRSIQRNLSRLEELINDFEARAPHFRPPDARTELLDQGHLSGAMEQRRLFELLDQRSMTHTWIGAQVGAEYLEMWHASDGRAFYRVTERAIRELQLGQLAASANYSSQSETAFAEDWDSEEDSVYDRL